MLISYPFLPPHEPNETEDQYYQRIVSDYELSGEGVYPVSLDKRWHGGIHMQSLVKPVTAIADGEVVAYRFAQTRENYEGVGEYDTSFVLLRHATETGEHTPVVFYSLYMHLRNRTALMAGEFQQLPQFLRQAAPGPNVRPGQGVRVYRKDVLGYAGQLYGQEALHFEIFATADQFAQFWKDSRSVTATGSADAFGDMHFVIPPNKEFRATHPRANAKNRIDIQGPHDFPAPALQAGRNPHRLYVTVKLERGDRITTSYAETAPNVYQLAGELTEPNYEYQLYALATALYPDCPSAGFEWLRFGRLIGPDQTQRNENLRLI